MNRTPLIVTIAIITLGIYDLACVTFGGLDISVSRFLQGAAFKSPFVTFSFGFICGHLFGYMKPVQQLVKEKNEQSHRRPG